MSIESHFDEIDLSLAHWEISEREERINEIENITGYVHISCAKNYLNQKIKELFSNYKKNHKDLLKPNDLIILDISNQDLYWIFYPKGINV